jgi:Mn-containing catalase
LAGWGIHPEWGAEVVANVMAESTGRLLATRLYEMTDDPGMKDMLSFLIARDTIHQNQWLAVLEEIGEAHPILNSFPQSQGHQEFSYAFWSTGIEGIEPPQGRWTSGASIDRKGEFSVVRARSLGQEPQLAPAPEEAHAQLEESQNVVQRATHAATKLVGKTT